MMPKLKTSSALTETQLAYIQELIAEICNHPPGNGAVTIVIHHGRPVYIIPAPNMDWPVCSPAEQDDPC